MDSSGLLLPEDILDTAYVEELYISPRNYMYQMNRTTEDERDFLDQQKENGTEPVTLERIEAGVPDFDSRLTKTFVQGRVNHSRMTDIELCRLIDEKILPSLFKNPDQASVYGLSTAQKAILYDRLWQRNLTARYQRKDPLLEGKTFTEAQLARCLCMKYEP